MYQVVENTKKGLTRTQRKFLKIYVDMGNILKSAKASGIQRGNHYCWMQDEGSVYAEEFERQADIAAGLLEDEAFRRAYEGNLEPVFQGGERVGEVRKYSDNLLMFLLKGLKPSKYSDKVATQSAIEVTHKVDIVNERTEVAGYLDGLATIVEERSDDIRDAAGEVGST